MRSVIIMRENAVANPMYSGDRFVVLPAYSESSFNRLHLTQSKYNNYSISLIASKT